VQACLDRGYSVVATSRKVIQAGLSPSPNLALCTDTMGRFDGAMLTANNSQAVTATEGQVPIPDCHRWR
jgi:hypothetical protein